MQTSVFSSQVLLLLGHVQDKSNRRAAGQSNYGHGVSSHCTNPFDIHFDWKFFQARLFLF